MIARFSKNERSSSRPTFALNSDNLHNVRARISRPSIRKPIVLASSRAPNLPLHFRVVGKGIVCCERTLKVRHTAECGFDKQILFCACTHDRPRGAFWLTHEENRIVSRNGRKVDEIQRPGNLSRSQTRSRYLLRNTIRCAAPLLRYRPIDGQEGTLRFNRFRLRISCS